MEYFLSTDGKKGGPHRGFDIIQRIREGTIDKESLIWRQGLDSWTPLGQLDEFTSYWPVPQEVITHAEAERQKARIELDRPRPWLRFWARMIDYFWFMGLTVALTSVFVPLETLQELSQNPSVWIGVLFNVTFILLFVPVEALLLSKYGSTPGKKLLRIQIARTEAGGTPSYQQALVRSLHVAFKAMGLGVSVLASALLISWWRLRLLQRGSTPWDETAHTRVEHGEPEPWRYVTIAGILTAIFFIVLIGIALRGLVSSGSLNLPG